MPKSSKKTQRSKLPKTGVQASSRRNVPRRGRKRGNARSSNNMNNTRGGRVSRSSGGGIFSKATNFRSNSTSLPAAFVTLQDNSTFISAPKKVTHPFLGVDGVALVGCQPLSTIGMTNTASDASVFSNNTLASVNGDSGGFPAIISLSPDALNGPIAAQANLHSKFVFRDVIVEYVSNCATSQGDSMCIGYVGDDGTTATIPSTFSTLRQVVPSCTFPFRSDRAYLHYHYTGMDTFFTKFDAATIAGTRITTQGALVAYADKVQGNVAAVGYTNIFYNIELYYPVASQSITFVQAKSLDERDIALNAIEHYRRKKLEGLELPRLRPFERLGSKYPIDDSKEYDRKAPFEDRKIGPVSSLGKGSADTASLIGDDSNRQFSLGPPQGTRERDREEIIADYVKLRSLSKDRTKDVVALKPIDKPSDKSCAK